MGPVVPAALFENTVALVSGAGQGHLRGAA